MMGEVLVHDYRHSLLHALIEVAPVFQEASSREEVFYSPWRDDRRALAGILHAMFTFIGVATFFKGTRSANRMKERLLAEP